MGDYEDDVVFCKMKFASVLLSASDGVDIGELQVNVF